VLSFIPSINLHRHNLQIGGFTKFYFHLKSLHTGNTNHPRLSTRQADGRRRLFGDQEIFFLQSLCDYAAIAIENARAVEKIQELTITDDCTGLYNARHLYKTLETEVYRSSRFGYEFTVVFIDLDHFKQVNDTNGHLVGSKLLAEIGYLIKAQLRLIDYAFRYGGDEFVVLLPQTGKDSALVVAKRLRDSLRTSMFCKEEGLNLNVRASMGVATYPHDAKTPHDIIRQADEMMYLVKNTSRDNIGIAQRGVMK